jgi:hypothetical protein
MDNKEKIGCPITLGEYEEIVKKEKEQVVESLNEKED